MSRRRVLPLVLVAVFGLVLLVLLVPLLGAHQTHRCEPVSTSAETTRAVAGLDETQMRHAAVIVSTAQRMGLDSTAAVVGVMTALTESSLRNLGYGDQAGPDSRGLFQQRTGWGPQTTRMDPAAASRLFFTALQAVPAWQQLEPWMTAQTVQRSAYADGSNYRTHYTTARSVVDQITTGDTAELASTSPDADCSADQAWQLVSDSDRDRRLPGAQATAQRAHELVGSEGYYRLCARLAANIWGHTHSGFYSAAEQWQAMIAAGHAHAGDRDPPVGALVFWDTGGAYGHVAVHVGDGHIVSNDIGDSYPGQGGVYLVPIDTIEEQWGARYLGWSPPRY